MKKGLFFFRDPKKDVSCAMEQRKCLISQGSASLHSQVLLWFVVLAPTSLHPKTQSGAGVGHSTSLCWFCLCCSELQINKGGQHLKLQPNILSCVLNSLDEISRKMLFWETVRFKVPCKEALEFCMKMHIPSSSEQSLWDQSNPRW